MTPIFDEIRASDISAWANRAESERLMPLLIQQLVLSSTAKISSCRFLAHEQTNHAGWDGIVVAETSGLNVPIGTSAWELSKREDVPRKANTDVHTRSQNPGEVSVPDSTFVVVTLRMWPKRRLEDGTEQDSGAHKAAWAKEQEAAYGWKSVQVIDAVDLATWLSHAPGVALWFAQVTGQRVVGASSLLEHWNRLSTLRAGLTPAIFLAGRKSFRDSLDRWLESPAEPFEVQTAAYDDLRDAIAAWIEERSRTASTVPFSAISVRTNDAWNQLIKTQTPLLLLVDDGLELAIEQMSAATASGHYVIHRTSAVHSRGTGCPLPRLHRDALADELQKCGIDNQDAWRMAGEISGSGVALKRMLLGHGPEPAWAKKPMAVDLAPAILLGAWDRRSDGDKEVVATLFGENYEEVETLLEPWAQANDPLARRNDDYWRIVAREDAWRWLATFLKPDQLDRFREAAVLVLTEIDPRFDLPADQRMFARIRKVIPRYSPRIRRAIAETLCLLSLRSTTNSERRQAEQLSRSVVTKVFENAGDWRLWASLDHSLMLLAEAAPDVFLEIVEQDLASEAPATVALFDQGGDNLFGEHPHVELMWALEALLWERAWVTRAIMILARLAARDIGGNMNPRPLGVLREAFLPWFPQCCLDVDDRCRVLDKILEIEPRVGWKLFFGLLPKTHDASSPMYRPSFRKGQSRLEPGASNVEYWRQVSHVARRLVEVAGEDMKRWEQLIGQVHTLPDDIFDVVLVELEKRGDAVPEDARFRLWEALRKTAANHRYFAKARWAMDLKRLEKLEKLVIHLEPMEPTLKHEWLFTGYHVHLPGTDSETPLDEQKKLCDEARIVALREIVAHGGLPSIRDLASRLKDVHAGRLGFLAAENEIVIADSEILPNWLNADDASILAFARGYASARFSFGGWNWLLSQNPGVWEPEIFGELTGILPFSESTWDAVSTLGPDYAEAFWQRTWPSMNEATTAEAQRAVSELIDRGRAFAALDCIHSCSHHKIPVMTETVLKVLSAVRDMLIQKATASGEKQRIEQMDEYHLVKVFELLQEETSLTEEEHAAAERLEWSFLPILKEHGSPRLLLEQVRREPSFFVELLEAVFWPDNLPKEQRVLRTEQQQSLAKGAHELLEGLGRLPGAAQSGGFDETAFIGWVNEVRRIASEKDLRASCDRQLGQLFLNAPVDPSGYWPCAPVCRFLSEPASDSMRKAFDMAIFNNQGWPGPFGDGMMMSSLSERQQAVEKLSELAGLLDLEFPIVANLLRHAAGQQEESCRRRRDHDD